MPEIPLPEAEESLRRMGRFAWLLDGRQAWSVSDLAQAYEAAIGVAISHDTVMRWFKRLPDGGAENYGGTIGWRAQRDALVVFFASGGHLLRKSADDASEQAG